MTTKHFKFYIFISRANDCNNAIFTRHLYCIILRILLRVIFLAISLKIVLYQFKFKIITFTINISNIIFTIMIYELFCKTRKKYSTILAFINA